MLQIRSLATLFTLLLLCLSTQAANSPRYSSGEHMFIGDSLQININGDGNTESRAKFTLSNGAEITYGELVAMGDFYGMEDKPISKGKTLEEREARFVEVFNQIDVNASSPNELKSLTAILRKEEIYIQHAIISGKSAKEAYSEISGDLDRQFNCATGGGCSTSTWWLSDGRLLKLASTNFDHFGDDAWLSYEAGHLVAMKEAAKAAKTHDTTVLARAYAMNALASHFLSDRYASGHMRAPRVVMKENVTPSSAGNLLMKYMHDEDGDGLNVHNERGDNWRAYGDNYYFEAVNEKNRTLLIEAMQASADEIDSVYQTGELITDSPIKKWIPIPNESHENCHADVAVMFYYDAKTNTIYRRSDLSDPHSCKWTSFWFGWSTAIKLAQIKGIPLGSQVELARSQDAAMAVEKGLITDPNVIQFVKRRLAK